MTMKLEEIDLNNKGAFEPGCAEFSVTSYSLDRDWDYILGNERLFWRIHHNGKGYLQQSPPGGDFWLRAVDTDDIPPWLVYIIPEVNPHNTFTNFWGPRLCDGTQNIELDDFQCHFALGKASWHVRNGDIEVITTLGVLPDEDEAIMHITITNLGNKPLALTVMPVITPYLRSTQEAAWDMPFLYQSSSYEKDNNCVNFQMRDPSGQHIEQRRHLSWQLDHTFSQISLSKTEFIGRGSMSFPEALTNNTNWSSCKDHEVYGEYIFAAFSDRLKLNAGDTFSFNMSLSDTTKPIQQDCIAALNHVGEIRTEQLKAYNISTPDAAFNRYVNEFLAMQQITALNRGWPCRMLGVRDSAQDYTAVAAWQPESAKKMIRKMLECQRYDGSFPRQFSTDGRHGKHDLRPYVDSGLWVWELMYETVCMNHSFTLFNEQLPYLDNDERESCWRHMLKIVQYLMAPDNIGEHGLCKIREGDWNDSANAAGLEGRGESVMTSCHLIYCLKQGCILVDYLKSIGTTLDLPDTSEWKIFAKQLRSSIRQHALNKQGFLNGVFSDNGSWFFSDCDQDGESRFNTPVNAFGMIAGIFTDDEIPRLLDCIRTTRQTYGYLLFDPPLGEPPLSGLGRIASGDLRPGLGENGTCYNHGANGFLARGLAAADCGDLFLDAMHCMFPYDQRTHSIAQSKTAPYAIVNVYMSAPGRNGEGGDTFFSGSIATAFRNIYQGLLGIHAHPAGFDVKPCLPPEWENISGHIIYAGRTLKINICRTDNNYAISVNGKTLNGGKYRPEAN